MHPDNFGAYLVIEFAADLLVKDSFDASAVDYIHNKQLNYCGMVLRAHTQGNERPVEKNVPAAGQTYTER